MKHFVFSCAASVAVSIGLNWSVPVHAQGSPAQWNYSFNTSGNAQAVYPSNVVINGPLQANAPTTFNPDGISLSPLAVYGNPAMIVAGEQSGHAGSILAYTVNNAPSATYALPSAIAGWGDLPLGQTGNAVFGVYGVASIEATSGGAAGAEWTVRNYSGVVSDTNLPPNLNIGSSTVATIGENVTCGGTNNCSIGVNLTSEAGSTYVFNTGEYIHNFAQYGIFVSSQTSGNQVSIVSQNNGTGLNLHMQTTGTFTQNNAVMDVADTSSNVHYKIVQSGDSYARAWQSNTLNVPTVTSGTGGGTGATYTLDTGSNDGTGIVKIAAGTGSAGFGAVNISFSLSNGLHNSSCILTPGPNFLGNTSVIVTAQSSSNFIIGYVNGGSTGTAFTSGTVYSINYFCPGH